MVGWRKRLGFAAAIELTLRSFVAKGAPQGDGWLFWVSRWMVKRAASEGGPYNGCPRCRPEGAALLGVTQEPTCGGGM
jgi:hypothetical protein